MKGRREEEGRVSEDSRKESGVLLRMKGSRVDERAERKQRKESFRTVRRRVK